MRSYPYPTGCCLHPRHLASASATKVETIALFKPEVPETPESIQVDRHGIIYVSLARTGEIRKIDPRRHPDDSGFPTAAPGDICMNRPWPGPRSGHRPRSPGQRVRRGERVRRRRPRHLEGDTSRPAIAGRYATSGKRGPTVLPIMTAGSMSPIAPSGGSGGSTVTVRAQRRSGLRLAAAASTLPPAGLPAANGLQIFRDKVYVSVSTRGHIVAFPISADGSAGPGRVHVKIGVDDFAFDVQGNLYAMTQIDQTVLRVSRDGRTLRPC